LKPQSFQAVRPHRAPLWKELRQAAVQMRRLLQDAPQRSTAIPSLTASETDLVYFGLRSWGLTQVRLQRLAKKRPEDGLAMLLSVTFGALRRQYRAPSTLVSQAVQAAQAWAGQPGARFVNAILRQTLSDPLGAAQDLHHPVARWNAPDWWIDRMHQSLGLRAPVWLDHQQRLAPLTVRYIGPAQERQSWIEALAREGLTAWPVGPAMSSAFHLHPPRTVTGLPGFREGWFRVQDLSAQRCSGLLSVSPGQCVWDACAAPGGKSFLLAEQPGIRVYASDLSSARLERLSREWGRLQPQLASEVHAQAFDPRDEASWPAHWPGQFDHLVLDLPCSASGVVRRHPEIPWRRSPDQLQALAQTQWELLRATWPRLRPGGELLLITCSVFSAEGEELVQRWQNETCHVERLSAPGLLIAEGERVGDGFFVARLRKTPAR
jgi:16S rRNA (cytosine967-C5)-methyltransferase